MKCEICGKDILKDSQCINYKYYHNDCIINLIKENQELKEENKKYKEVIYEVIDYIETKIIRKKAIIDIDVLEEILKEVE